MYLITEFSKLTAVSVRMLRYYDKHDVFKPFYIDDNNQYRYYSAAQIPLLNRIKVLRDFGFHVNEIKTALTLTDSEFTGLLEERSQVISADIQKQLNLLNKITLLKNSPADIQSLEFDLTLKPIPDMAVLSLRRIIPTYFHEEELWKEFTQYLYNRQLPIPDKYTSFTIFHDKGYQEHHVDLEIAIEYPLPQINKLEKPYQQYTLTGHPLCACIMVIGPYHNIDPVYQRFAFWLENHPHYRMSGKTRQISHKGPWNCQSEDEYLTELLIPVILQKTLDHDMMSAFRI